MTETSSDQPPVPAWQAELNKVRRERERTQDVDRKWQKYTMTGGEGEAPWIKEVAVKKKAAKEKAEEEAKVPQWLREVKGKNPSLTRHFTVEENDDQ